MVTMDAPHVIVDLCWMPEMSTSDDVVLPQDKRDDSLSDRPALRWTFFHADGTCETTSGYYTVWVP